MVQRTLQFNEMRGVCPSLPGLARKVCVIGAGISGLRAAGLLAVAGFEVTVLEARDHVGGRIYQSSRFGLPIDLGACWIHGTQGNPIVDLAEKARSMLVACGAVYSICDSNGAWLSSETARHYYEEVWEILEMMMDKSRKEAASLSDSAKMMDLYRQEVRKRRVQAKNPEAYETLMVQIVEMWGAFMGNECETQGLENLWLDAGLEGGIVDPVILPFDELKSTKLLARQLIYGVHSQRHYSQLIASGVEECHFTA